MKKLFIVRLHYKGEWSVTTATYENSPPQTRPLYSLPNAHYWEVMADSSDEAKVIAQENNAHCQCPTCRK